MYFSPVESDQLYTWSDENEEERACRHLEKTPPSPPAPTAPTQGDPARLADRALQTLWQARMQVRRRSWPRPQVLLVSELSRLAATNGLCAAGVSRSDRGVHRQLPPSPRDLRGDLRDQPRTAAPPGGALNERHERSDFRPPVANRCWIGWRAPRQYGRSLARWQPGRCDKRGAANELQDHGTTPEQTGLHLCPPVDECPGAPPPGKHGAPVCTANDGVGTGLERISDSHARPGPGHDGDRDDQTGGFQNSGGRCLDGSGGGGVCAGSLATGALESRLASAAGVVRAHCDAGDRRRRLLRSVGFQRRPFARIEGDHGSSR